MRKIYLCVGLLVALSACSAGAPPVGKAAAPLPSAAASNQTTGPITVFAAASLTDAFTEIGQRFQSDNPDANVTFNFGASTQLFTQIEQGAPADVFASADQIQMDRAESAGLINAPNVTFATNRLVVITPANNPGGVEGPGDLAKPGLRVVTSQPDVPIGVYTQAMVDRMSQDSRYGAAFKDAVNANIVSREANVRQVVAKVQIGEADAAVVYRTDVTPRIASQVATFDIPDELNTLARYPIALVQNAPNPDGAKAFTGYVLSPAGQRILASWNFTPVAPAASVAPAAANAGSARAR